MDGQRPFVVPLLIPNQRDDCPCGANCLDGCPCSDDDANQYCVTVQERAQLTTRKSFVEVFPLNLGNRNVKRTQIIHTIMIFALNNVRKFSMTACNHAHAMINRAMKNALPTIPRALLNVHVCHSVEMDVHVMNMNAEIIRFMILVYM